MCIGVSTSIKNTTNLVFGKPPPLKSANCPSPLLFRQFPPIYWFFVTPSPKNRIFQWTLIILKLFVFNPIPSFKKLKLAKISLFKFSYDREKHFCLHKSLPLSKQPPSKSCQALLFEDLVWSVHPRGILNWIRSLNCLIQVLWRF